MFAQQRGLQPFSLGAFERMQEAAGNRSGATAMASATVNRTVPVFRMPFPSTGCAKTGAGISHSFLAFEGKQSSDDPVHGRAGLPFVRLLHLVIPA